MANTNNPEAWAAQERLRFIERSLWWRGGVQRKDLCTVFGISLAQASADLQRYFQENKDAASYDLSAKLYRGQPGMTCRFHTPELTEALSLFLNDDGMGIIPRTALGPGSGGVRETGDQVVGVTLPIRKASPSVERAVFYAVWAKLSIQIDYMSLSGKKTRSRRRIVPHAFAHDGYRWHVRAWCEENKDYRDFVLSRIRSANWPEEAAPSDLPEDTEWSELDNLVLQPNPSLPEEKQESIAWDFGMEGGTLRFSVRRALRNYLLINLGLPPEGMKTMPPLLALTSTPAGGSKPSKKKSTKK